MESLETWYLRVEEAAALLRGNAHMTPVMTSSTLDRLLGARVYLKCENFQRMGAFKFRGAFNAMSRLSEEARRKGVVTHSSGNHAQAVALVGRLLGIRTVIVMPDNAPVIKRTATEGYGAEVVEYDPEKGDRQEISMRLAQEHGYHLVPPFDDADIIAGQGTAALELCSQTEGLDVVLCPCGGGGLLSGTAVAVKGSCPGCRVVGVEPELANDACLSFQTGTLHTIRNPPTIADGTRTPSLGRLTFPMVLEFVDDMKSVSENAIRETVRFLFDRMKLVVEPSGVLGLAALLEGKVEASGRIGVILSGGNIDRATMAEILSEQ
ncbi:MAG TPA: threo-3-hydroxy-L-aspartate ammonia-lyase [Desulfobacteraceae bacterium]|jgi:threo-3-hydroxy-L-aspartate ammonia-lyase|nr:threo-3-hydroxy-L-aspartate ammonia-lyase [Desulfobacteraceae bacterium]